MLDIEELVIQQAKEIARLKDLWFSDADPEEIPSYAGQFAVYQREKETRVRIIDNQELPE